MKRFFLLLMLIPSISMAEEVKLGEALSKLPALKQGIGYSVLDNKINYLSTVELANIGKYVNIEAGYAGAAENSRHKVVAVVSLNLLEAGDIHYPILKYLKFNPGWYIGAGDLNIGKGSDGNNEFDTGISATFFEVKI